MKWFGKEASPVPAKPLPMDNKDVGNLGEDVATTFLTTNGFKIIERNFRCKGGEIDIVARSPKDKSLVFVEVKTRRTLSYGVPQLAVTPFKQRQISKAALTWLAINRQQDAYARFDVIAILLSYDGQHKVEHIVNAFELGY